MAALDSSPSATATQLVRDFPEIRRLADEGPVRITSHGRTELVMLSPETFNAMVDADPADDHNLMAARLDWKLSIVLDSIDTNVLILDEQLRVQRVNASLCELIGISAENVVGQDISKLIIAPGDRFIIERLAEVLRTSAAEIFTLPSPRVPSRTIRVRIKPWPGGVVMFAEDITERVKMRDRIIADHALDYCVDKIGGVGMAYVRSDGTMLSGTLGLSHMVGVETEALTGARFQSLFAPKSRGVVEEALLSNANEATLYEIEYLKSGVTATPATLTVTPYWTAEHHACAAVALFDRSWLAA